MVYSQHMADEFVEVRKGSDYCVHGLIASPRGLVKLVTLPTLTVVNLAAFLAIVN
jgi:hypothetical protein